VQEKYYIHSAVQILQKKCAYTWTQPLWTLGIVWWLEFFFYEPSKLPSPQKKEWEKAEVVVVVIVSNV